MDETLKTKVEKLGRKKARMVTFRGKDALPVSDEMMPQVPVGPDVQAKMVPLMENGIMDGGDVRCLFRDQGSGMSLVYVWFKGGYVLPRHSHNANCLYYIIAGELNAGSVVLRQGDGFFVPADMDYTYTAGPEGVELLEFRDATTFDIDVTRNDATMWARVLAAVTANKGKWQSQTKPPQRQ
jgi:quercetin dioxygenase-like cupin family protein